MIRRLLTIMATLVLTAGVVAGCGGGDTASKAAPGGAATFNDADVTFAQGMIPHHEQAVEMADIALDPKIGASANVKALSKRIKDAQGPEIATMTAWLKDWDKPVTRDGGHAMSGMMSATDMEDLSAATGPAFDSAFYKGMIEHHEGAITMAETVQKDGSNPDVRALAGRVISAQTTEIDEMTKALAS